MRVIQLLHCGGGIDESTSPAEASLHLASLREYLRRIRIDAEAVVLEPAAHSPAVAAATMATAAASRFDWDTVRRRPEAVRDINRELTKHSADAALVLLALPELAPGDAEAVRALRALVQGLPPTLLCKSGGEPVVATDI